MDVKGSNGNVSKESEKDRLNIKRREGVEGKVCVHYLTVMLLAHGFVQRQDLCVHHDDQKFVFVSH